MNEDPKAPESVDAHHDETAHEAEPDAPAFVAPGKPSGMTVLDDNSGSPARVPSEHASIVDGDKVRAEIADAMADAKPLADRQKIVEAVKAKFGEATDPFDRAKAAAHFEGKFGDSPSAAVTPAPTTTPDGQAPAAPSAPAPAPDAPTKKCAVWGAEKKVDPFFVGGARGLRRWNEWDLISEADFDKAVDEFKGFSNA